MAAECLRAVRQRMTPEQFETNPVRGRSMFNDSWLGRAAISVTAWEVDAR